MSGDDLKKYDAIVIGSGQGGKPWATELAGAGKKTALIERAHIGGTCINYGCTPTKTMVASARAAYLARRGEDYGVETGKISINMETVRDRKRKIVKTFRESGEKGIDKTDGLDLFRGEARFVGERTLEIDLNNGGIEKLAADWVFINTGVSPRIPSLEGLDGINYLTNVSIMELDRVPERLIVLGGGYVGVEFGQMFRRFGSEVTIINRGQQLLGHEDDDVADEVKSILEEDGISIHLGVNPKQVARNADGGVVLTFSGSGGEKTVSGSALLVAVGRVPNTTALKPEQGGVELNEQGYVQANERLETTADGVWVLGDVKGGPAFTHISYDDMRILKENLFQGGNRTTNDREVPYVVYMDPQLGRVGMTEAEAQKAGKRYRVAKLPMTHVARALETDETRGFMKVLVDDSTHQILGAAILGPEGGEVMAVLQVAMHAKVRYTAIRDMAIAHPSYAESLNNLFMTLKD